MKVTRENNSYQISWDKSEAPEGSILYVSEKPEQDSKEVEVMQIRQGNHYAEYPVQAEYPHPFFIIKKPTGEKLTAAERILTVPGVFNFRDLGGYLSRTGKRVKWGKLFRSGSLGAIKPEGEKVIHDLNIRWICDLRSAAEVKVQQTPPMDGILNRNIPIGAAKNQLDGPKNIDIPSDHSVYEPLMGDSYKVFIQSTAEYKQIFEDLLQKDGIPFLFHCTAGKDRTGILAALTLYLLDVPEQTIFEDYELTNQFTDQILNEVGSLANSFSNQADQIPLETFRPMAEARPAYLKIAFQEMRKSAGSIDAFLEERVGIDAKMKEQLQALLLE
ncbi:protein-tyrosine-phosphatase [Listeria floridensis FSL S10-1187]|uniref:Protein-tyrosine-phosphatase n=1 Tax=Listeria floridensis FSL S10-1187 TaxID=1265817 RepID=A0ABN0RE63_9LIST|nr:tyrosine-protein phosphatase [Listeria floridensis]EUJ30776.1 protein-tyrosine-phosphatase [Listeria floridensis FSL S10-1187]